MVKYKSLLENYRCNSVDGIENHYKMSASGVEDISHEDIQEAQMKAVEDQYVPPWRAACDAWVTENVLDSPGDNTPVYQLYNAYIKDNPDDYMDIGQFGKVLRSRFPYRKRRRGKQGQQVYVYQDVALKKKADLTEQVERPKQQQQQKSFETTFQNAAPLAGPAIVLGNSSGALVFSSTSQGSDQEYASLFKSSTKRQGTESSSSSSSSSLQLSPSQKRQKVSKETGILGLSNDNTLRFQSSFSPHFGPRKPIAPTTSLMRQDQNAFNDKQNNDIIFKNKPLEKIDKGRLINPNFNKSEDIQWTKVKCIESRSPNSKDDKIFDKVVMDIGTSNIAENFHCNVNFPNTSTPKNGFKAKQNLISDVTFFKQKSDEINIIGVTSDSVVQRNSNTNLHTKYDSSNTKTEDEKYANSSLCRMAIGRRWIDTNLIDKPGIHTYADDICRAYAEDHPDEPLTFTSLALLIRGKYPGRRRKVSDGRETKYLYQDIKLLRSPAEKSGGGATSTYNEEPVTAQGVPPAINLIPASQRERHFNTVPYVLVPVIGDPTAPSNIPAFFPVNYKSSQQAANTPLLAYSRPSSAVSFAKTNSGALQSPVQKNFLTFESLLTDDDEKPKSLEHTQTENTDFHDRLSRRNSQMLLPKSEGVEYLTDKLPDVTVSDYLEKELLDINKLNASINNYTLSIKFPSGKQEISESIPSFSSAIPQKPVNIFASAGKRYVMQESEPKEKKSWDYGMRKSMGVTSDASVIQPEISQTNNKRNKDKRGKNRKSRKVITPDTVSENINSDEQEATERYITTPVYTPQKEYEDSTSSTFSKSSGGSPTSTSPPCTAMFRLAEEIDTSTPYVTDSAHKVSLQSSSASTSVRGEETEKQLSNINPEFRKALRSVILTARQILSIPELSSETCIEMRLEKAIIGNNPAVDYVESMPSVLGASTADSFPCSIKPDLQNLMQYSTGQISDLLRHHQTCPGLGCSTECQTLRAAYIHLTIFRHRCHVWEAFKDIVSKHSKQCRLVSCGVAFCQYVKHELHVSGVSILPMQLLKERLTLEEEFRKCEAIGTHDGDLHCRHMRYPFLPNKNSAVKRRREDEQPNDDVTMDTNFIFPDTPSGNALSVPALKTINLIKSLFQISTQSN